MSVSLSSITNTGQNDFITRSLLISNMVQCNTPSYTDCFRMDLCGDRSMKAATTAQVTVWDTGWLLWGESFIFLSINTLFPKLRVALQRHGFPNRCWNGVITWFIIRPVLSLCIQTLATKLSSMDYVLITVIPNFTQHATNEKMWPWVLAYHSFVTCAWPHRVIKACKVMRSHKMQT